MSTVDACAHISGHVAGDGHSSCALAVGDSDGIVFDGGVVDKHLAEVADIETCATDVD